MSAEGGNTRRRARDPYLGMRFRVEVDSINVAGFSEVSGLEAEVETEEYQEGGENTYTHRIPTRVTYPNLVLRRGVADPQLLWEWFHLTTRVADVPKQMGGSGRLRLTYLRRDVDVVLCDSTGADASRWSFRNAYPVRWEGPQLQADQGAVAIEALELTHEGVTRERRFGVGL